MKEEILKKYGGKYSSINEITAFAERLNEKTSRKTVVWSVNDLVRQGKATRFGRGVYGFMAKPRFVPEVGEAANRACSLLSEHFRYLVVTVTDSNVLGQFMNLQPFSTVIVIEAKKTATAAVQSVLRQAGIEAYAKSDYSRIERYITSSQPFIVRPELSVNPSLPQKNNIRTANLEKLLVDLVCDEDIYGQYQGEELLNIYQNATERYAVNFSQILKYAAQRKKKAPVVELLQGTVVYNKIRSLV